MTTVFIQVNPNAHWSLPILDLQWFQRCHDNHYHRDVYYMQTIPRIRHLHSHLVKYANRNFNELSEETNFPDALACIFGIADALNMSISKQAEKLGYKAETIGEIEIRTDPYAAYKHFQLHLAEMAKALEGWDHIEDIDYQTTLRNTTTVLFLLLFVIASRHTTGMKQQTRNRECENMILVKQWHDRLAFIKSKNEFHDYIADQYFKSDTLNNVRFCLQRDLVDLIGEV